MKIHTTTHVLRIYDREGGHADIRRDFVGNVSHEELETWARETFGRIDKPIKGADVVNALGKHVMSWSSEGTGKDAYLVAHNASI